MSYKIKFDSKSDFIHSLETETHSFFKLSVVLSGHFFTHILSFEYFNSLSVSQLLRHLFLTGCKKGYSSGHFSTQIYSSLLSSSK